MVQSSFSFFGSVVLRRLTIAVASTAALLCGRWAGAAPIVYTYTGTATGMFGATDFTAANYSISLTSDTTLVIPQSEGAQVLGAATVYIAGIGSGTFTDAMGAFDNTFLSEVLFSDFTSDREVLGVPASAFATYGLTTSIGPITGSGDLLANDGSAYPTTFGDLSFTAVQSATFSARVSAVPEPASLSLIACAAIGLLSRRRTSVTI